MDECFSLYEADKWIFVNQCHNGDLGSRSQKGHPVHFSRPIPSLSQISKVQLKRFLREKQKSAADAAEMNWKHKATPERSDLTHWGRDKIDATSQTTFWSAFSWMKMFEFIEVCSWGSNWQYSSIGLDNGLAPSRRQAIIWTNDG